MTVLSILADRRQGALLRNPLDLGQCVQALRSAPQGKTVRVCMRPVRHSKVSTSRSVNQKGIATLKDASSFIFCLDNHATGSVQILSLRAPANAAVDDADEVKRRCHAKESFAAGVQLPPFTLANLGLLLPAAVAAHGGLLSAGAVCACLPIMAPFAIPPVSPNSWMASKRARAFHRCCVLGAYTQGVLSVLKFGSGDLVGGVYLLIQAGMGYYATTVDGTGLMPSYMLISGFNGVIGIAQVLQQSQGVPLKHVLAVPSVWLPPAISILACYWGWQFIKEMQAIGAGMPGHGSQDSCWVNFMGTDIWPISALSPNMELPSQNGDSSTGNRGSRFTTFAGDGHRLGEEAAPGRI